jgi:hypothetical protein
MSSHIGVDRKSIPDGDARSRYLGRPPTASVRAAWVAAGLLCVVATFHAALVLGAPWGEVTQGGGTTGTLGTSGRLVAALSCLVTAVMAGAILGRVGRGPFRLWPARLRAGLAWATPLYAGVGAVLDLITRSAAERALWAPVSLLLLGLVTFVMVSTSSRRSFQRTRRVV